MKKTVADVKRFAGRQKDRLQRSATGGWHFWRTWVRSIYLPDGVNLYMDSFIRVVFCFYHIPTIIVVLAVTHSALERVVWVLVVPITQEMERNPYHFSSLQTLTAGLSRIAVKIAPFAALGISFATVGHKATNCFVEAMLDAYTSVNEKDYPLLHARLQFVLEKRSRIYMFLLVLVSIGFSVVYAFRQNTIAFLSRDEPHVLIAAAVVAVTQGLFIMVTVILGAPDEVIVALAGSFGPAVDVLSALRSPKRRGKDARSFADGNASETTTPTKVTAPGSSGQPARGEYAEYPLSKGAHSPYSNHTSRHAPRSPAAGNTPLDASSPCESVASSEAGGSAFDPPDVTTRAVRFVAYFFGDWWTHNMHYMRYIGFTMAALFGLQAALSAGPIQGVTSAVLLLMCLNFPHSLGYLSLMVTFAVIRTVRSFRWVARHRDVFLPVLVVDLPYQAILLNALYYFRHHPAPCALLLGVNVLLIARAIDLVWEYDVSEYGSVHWEDANRDCISSQRTSPNVRQASGTTTSTGRGDDSSSNFGDSLTSHPTSPESHAHSHTHQGQTDTAAAPTARVRSGGVGEATGENGLVKPSLAIILEDAYEKHHQRPGLVSLDMVMDIKRMRIRYADKKKKDVALTRHQIIPYGAGRRYLRDRNFYAYVLPRLLSLQSPGYFAGAQYRKARVLLRGISITALFLFTLIVFGMIVQAAFPQLRSFPVRVTSPADQSFLTVDHVVVRMNLLSTRPRERRGEELREGDSDGGGAPEAVGKSAMPGDGTVPDAAHAVFQWSNVTSSTKDDFYPQLCRRDYYGTSVWELSLLALAPYLFNLDEVGTLIDFMNAHLGSDWVIKRRHGASCVATDSAHTPTGWSGFYDFYSAKRDMSVVALRGTDLFSFTDFLIDINLFFEAVLYQAMTFVVPGSIVVPKELIVNLIRMVSLRGGDEPEEDVTNLDGAFEAARKQGTWAALVASGNSSLRRCHQNNYRRDFFVDVQNHLTYVATHPTDVDGTRRPNHVVLTGHSLAGASVAILGARMNLEAVAFSSPGIALARKKFNVDLRSIHKYVMTVISTNDIVPALGEQAGELHHVECLAVRRELCHAMEFMVGSLWRSCNSVRERFPLIADVV